MPSRNPYAEDVNYWMTSRSSPDDWMEKTKKLITGMGGTILGEAFLKDAVGRSAYMLAFSLKDDHYKIVWPVLQSRSKNEKAARVQASTLLHHDIKAKCLTAIVMGARVAFLPYIQLPDGRTAAEATTPELTQGIPNLFTNQQPQLDSGDVITGEYKEIK